MKSNQKRTFVLSKTFEMMTKNHGRLVQYAISKGIYIPKIQTHNF